MPDALTLNPAVTADLRARALTIRADDGVPLAATLFEPSRPASADAPLIVFGPAAAVPARYYARFASWLAERGHPVCGDRVYIHKPDGTLVEDRSAAPRLALHAVELGFRHPAGLNEPFGNLTGLVPGPRLGQFPHRQH